MIFPLLASLALAEAKKKVAAATLVDDASPSQYSASLAYFALAFGALALAFAIASRTRLAPGLLPADAMARLIMTRKYMPAPCFSPAGDPIPVVTAVCRFATAPSRAAVLAIARRVGAFPRFRALPELGASSLANGFRPVAFDPEAHVREHAVADDAARDATVSRLVCSTPLPTDVPWWALEVVRNARGEDALLIRVDHTLGDGLGLLRVFLAACETADGAPFPETSFDFVGASAQRAGRPAGGARAALGRALALAWRAAWSLALVVKEAARKDSRTAVSPAPLNPCPNQRLAARLSPPLALAQIKAIKNAAGCTVNDVLAAAFAGALRAYLARAGGAQAVAEARLVRALIPVAFPRPKLPVEHAASVENKFSMCPTALAVGEPSARARLERTRATFATLKASIAPWLLLHLSSLIGGYLGIAVAAQTTHDIFSGITCVFSNVPGPPDPIYMGGQRVTSVGAFYPNFVTQYIFLGYEQSLRLGMTVDLNAIKEPEKMFEFLQAELDALEKEYVKA